MDMVMLITVVIISLVKTTLQNELFAQECRVYKIQTRTLSFKTPLMKFQNLLTVSVFSEDENDVPARMHIGLKGSKSSLTIHINNDSEVFLGHAKPKNFTIMPNYQNNTWISLAVLLQDDNVIVYRIDARENYISAKASLGTNVTAFVSTAQPSKHVHLNCPAGCLIHDNNSPLVRHKMPLGSGITIYVSHEEGVLDAKLTLVFKDNLGRPHAIEVDASKWEASLWHKVVVSHDKKNKIIVRGNGKVNGEVAMAEEDAMFTIQKASVLWSLHCHPDRATGLEGWIPDNSTSEEYSQDDDEEGAGVGEVLAWVLAGIALFLVMVMALLLCTKMHPVSGATDFGASVGVVTSFGGQMTYRNAEREAEEDTEPDSPTFLAPVIHHKVPEEEDEQQSNTKML